MYDLFLQKITIKNIIKTKTWITKFNGTFALHNILQIASNKSMVLLSFLESKKEREGAWSWEEMAWRMRPKVMTKWTVHYIKIHLLDNLLMDRLID